MSFEPLEAAAQVFMEARTVAFWRYFGSRRLGREILDRFRIGLSPSWPILERPRTWRQAFTDAGFFDAASDQPMFKYLGRYTFPLIRADETVVGFAFRDTGYPGPRDGTGSPEGGKLRIQTQRKRYDTLNTRKQIPWPPGFVAQPDFYGLPDVEQGKRVVLVEGMVDSLRCISAGYTETRAVMGISRVQERALTLLRDPERTVVLLLDADQAARLTAVRVASVWAAARDTYPGRLQVSVIPVSWEAKDPGDLDDVQIGRALSDCVLEGDEYLSVWPGRGIDPGDPWQVHVFSQWLDSLLGKRGT